MENKTQQSFKLEHNELERLLYMNHTGAVHIFFFTSALALRAWQH